MNSDQKRILIRGVNWIGDAVMTTPALMRLREKFPGAHIALLTPEKLRELWTNHPAVDEIISIAPGENIFAIAKKLHAESFDLALVLPNSSRSAIEIFLAGIPKRIGYARPWRNFFLTQAVTPRADAVKMRKRSVGEIRKLVAQPEIQIANRKSQAANPSAHQIHDYLHLAAALGASPEPLAPQLFVTPEDIKIVDSRFLSPLRCGWDNAGFGTLPLMGICPRAEYGPAKRWPIENFVEVVRKMREHGKFQWLLFGGKADIEFGWEFNRLVGGGVCSLAGKTSLRELMALLKLCRVLLTNDTGPMHVAAALGTPVVAIFGSTSPELTGPISSNELRHQILKSDAPCSPCFLRECPIDFRCMNGISVERVVEAVLQSV
jgi:lipopolysaccharide heptosyltransferase II